MIDNFQRRVLEQNHQVNREMTQLKGALTDFIYDNYNSSKQGNFLKKTEQAKGIGLPLKDNQIKVAKRDQVLIKRKDNKL